LSLFPRFAALLRSQRDIFKQFGRFAALLRSQRDIFKQFGRDVRKKGKDVLCYPRSFPALIRLPLYLAAAPGPLRQGDLSKSGFDPAELLARGVVKPLYVLGWYAFKSLDFADQPDANKLRRLFWLDAWNPLRKMRNTAEMRREAQDKVGS
jgi:hypothetical protein